MGAIDRAYRKCAPEPFAQPGLAEAALLGSLLSSIHLAVS